MDVLEADSLVDDEQRAFKQQQDEKTLTIRLPLGCGVTIDLESEADLGSDLRIHTDSAKAWPTEGQFPIVPVVLGVPVRLNAGLVVVPVECSPLDLQRQDAFRFISPRYGLRQLGCYEPELAFSMIRKSLRPWTLDGGKSPERSVQ